MHPFEAGLDRSAANYLPLSPVSFLTGAARAYANKVAVIDGERRYTYAQLVERCRRLASALAGLGVGRLDTVAIMAPNVPEMIEAHYAVPMLGAVLNPLNTRLDAATIAFSLTHGQARVLIADSEYRALVAEALRQVDHPITLIWIGDDYEAALRDGDPGFGWPGADDEWQSLCLLYTSGTTGDPKGAVYHHRGAYLQALGNAVMFGLGFDSVYLWTLPMFHCSGWSYLWAVVAVGGTQVCLRKIEPAAIFALIARHKVTHLYGATETYGPSTSCVVPPAWHDLPDERRYANMARQGVLYPTLEDMMVGDPRTMKPVPQDGTTVGEIMQRGNTVMKGYLKNLEATAKTLRDGWYLSGDLGVWHPDGYIEIKDRSKDIIISGGENISSLEVEEVLSRHPAVFLAAVVARPDATWGETPCAFIELRPDAVVGEAEIVQFCGQHLARFKVPKRVVFAAIPRTSTGKVQKFTLREMAKAL